MSLSPKTYESAKAGFKPLSRRIPLRSKSTLRSVSQLKTSPAKRGAAKSKPQKKAKPKVPTRKKLIKIIDSLVFQILLLMYDCCVECGSKDRPTTGHVLSRRSYATRWDFRNVYRQCWPDNYRAAMTGAAAYHAWFVRTYGAEAFEQLYRDWTKGRKYTRLELQNLVPEFQAKLAELKNNS